MGSAIAHNQTHVIIPKLKRLTREQAPVIFRIELRTGLTGILRIDNDGRNLSRQRAVGYTKHSHESILQVFGLIVDNPGGLPK